MPKASPNTVLNALGQPVGVALPAWRGCPAPPRTAMRGDWACLEPLDPDRHAAALHAANGQDARARMWTYLGYGPFSDATAYRRWLDEVVTGDDPLFFAIIDHRDGQPAGLASYLRIEPADGVIEIGHLAFAPRLQRTAAATEAIFLMLSRAFDELGYRRCEWKCDAANTASRAAAIRFGFEMEGVFRQARVVKGRNRDTMWFSILDHEWPDLRGAFQKWLGPANFDEGGRARERLSALTATIRAARSAE